MAPDWRVVSKVDAGVSIETWEVAVDMTPENLLRVGAQTRTLVGPLLGPKTLGRFRGPVSKVDAGVSIETGRVTMDTAPENLLRVGAQTKAQTRTLARPSVTILPCGGLGVCYRRTG